MKQFRNLNLPLLLLLFAALCFSSCHKDDNFPKEYIGFKHTRQTIKCSPNDTEMEIKIELIAGSKSSKDRTVQLSIPPTVLGKKSLATLTEKEVTIKAGKKSVTTIVKVYPSQMELHKQRVAITCIPRQKESSASKLYLSLEKVK